MFAVEFQTTIKDGVIKIPHQYLGSLPDRVRVILLVEESAKNAEGVSKLLETPPCRRELAGLPSE